MFASKLLCHIEGVNLSRLSKEEIILLEALFFLRICEELKELFKIQYKDYFQLIKVNIEKENTMMESNYVRCIINDILSTEEYSLPGIAYYTRKPEDVIFEVIAGKNTDPSASLLKKIIELHRLVRPKLYQEIIKKILTITDTETPESK